MTADNLTSLREDHREQTRARILDAAASLICEGDDAAVTMANVAKRAKVSERTVYRHFGDRGTLIRSVWARLQHQIEQIPIPANTLEVVDTPLEAFPLYEGQRQLLRAYLARQLKRQGELRAEQARRQAILDLVRNEFPDGALGRRRAAIVELLTSPAAWDRLCRVWGFDVAEAAEAAVDALEVLLGYYPAKDLMDEPPDAE